MRGDDDKSCGEWETKFFCSSAKAQNTVGNPSGSIFILCVITGERIP